MKKVFIVALAAMCIFCVMPLSAKSGVDLGYLNSSYRSKADGADAVKADPMNGFFVGVNNDIRLIAGLSIQPGLYYSYLNSTGSEEAVGFNISDSYTEHMLNIPIQFKYTFDIVPVFGVYVFAGPTLSLGLAATNKMSVTGSFLSQTIGGSVTYNAYSGKFKSEELSEEIVNTVNQYMPQSQMNRFDVLMGGGIGLDLLKFITVKGGFDYGLMNRYKGDLAEAGTLNRMQYYISVGIKF